MRAVQHLRLRKVGDLRRAADVGCGGQNRILEDGPQQRVGAQALGLDGKNLQQLRGGVDARAGLPLAVRGAAQRQAGAGFGVDQEEQRMIGGDQHLRVIASGLEILRAHQQRVFELVGPLQRSLQNACAHGVELARGGVHDDQAVLAQRSW